VPFWTVEQNGEARLEFRQRMVYGTVIYQAVAYCYGGSPNVTVTETQFHNRRDQDNNADTELATETDLIVAIPPEFWAMLERFNAHLDNEEMFKYLRQQVLRDPVILCFFNDGMTVVEAVEAAKLVAS
jgi:transketolase C-terminal domain/subunit